MVNPRYLAKLAEDQKAAVEGVVEGLAKLDQAVAVLTEKVNALGRMISALPQSTKKVKDGSSNKSHS